jgi:hypothetical protein
MRMKRLLQVITIAVYTAVGAFLFGILGMMLGSIVARTIQPRPNPHLMEGLEYVAGGTLIGAIVGALGAIALAVRAKPKTTAALVESSE